MIRAPLASLLALVCLVAPASGCATIFHGTQTSIPVTSTPPGQQILLDGVVVGVTPARIPVPSSEAHRLTVRSPYVGVADETKLLVPMLMSGYVFLDIFTAFVGLAVDAITGAYYELLPNAVHATFDASASPLP